MIGKTGMMTVALLAASGAAHAQSAPPAAPAAPVLQVVDVRPGLHVITGGGGNTIVRDTPQGMLLVDAKSGGAPIYRALLAQIRTIGTAPIRYVVNTHYHGDHSGNDAAFHAEGAHIVAQEGFRRELAGFVPPPFNPTETAAPLPDTLYANALTLRVGTAKVQLRYLGRGHTGSDSYVYFPDLKVLAFGDQLTTAPMVDYAGGGSLPQWIAALDRALAMPWDVAIPGHGAMMTRDGVVGVRDRLAIFLKRAQEQVGKGVTRGALFESIRRDDLWPMQPAFWTMPAQRAGLYADAGGHD